MGILDSKTRILDVFLTQEGRRQISQGDLRIEFASFTDDAAFYKADIISGTADATQRIYFEACNLPQDQITFESNDAGRLNSFKNIENITVRDGRLISSSYDVLSSSNIVSGSTETYEILSGEQFSSTSTSLLESSINNFQNLRILGTTNRLLDNEKFELSENDITFTITKDYPIDSATFDKQYLTKVDSLISDIKLSSQDNFLFLQPKNKNSKTRLGSYPNFRQRKMLLMDDVMKELSFYDKHGCSKQLRFDPTSNNNNVIAQIFEVTNNQITKLDVIDFGRQPYYDNQLRTSRSVHVFFVGKIYLDDNQDDTFIHLFTLVLS